jgi:signal transduction histidine kinase
VKLHRRLESWHRETSTSGFRLTGDEEIASLGTSLNTVGQNLNRQIQELSDGKQRLEHILEAMGQGMMVLDRAGRVTLTNTSIPAKASPMTNSPASSNASTA